MLGAYGDLSRWRCHHSVRNAQHITLSSLGGYDQNFARVIPQHKHNRRPQRTRNWFLRSGSSWHPFFFRPSIPFASCFSQQLS